MEDTLNRPTTTQFGGAKLIIGIFFVLHGLLLAADNIGLLSAWDYLRYWPAVILLLGIYKLWEPGRQLAGAILTVVGASLLAQNAGWLHLSVFALWPLLLIIGGIVVIARAIGFEVPSGDSRNIFSVFNARKIAPQDFDRANIVAIMGGCELDLTHAEMTHSPAVIDVFAMWGGIEIYVPDNWEIIGEVTPVMAGFEVKVAPKGAPQRQLVVRGAAIMAGIEVKRRES
jgi:predicted membrane protein